MSEGLCSVCFFKEKTCICQPFWKTFEEDLADVGHYEHISPSPLSISTMTFGMKLRETLIDLNRLKEQFRKSLFCRELKFKENAKKSKNDLEVNCQFYNQCTITSFIPSEDSPDKLIKISTKIFHNGSLNFTGLKNVRYIVHMVRYMLMYLKSLDGVIKTKGKLVITDAKISMINTDYKLGFRVRQKSLNEYLQNYSERIKMATFKPDNYNGVKINFICNLPEANSDNTKITRKGVRKTEGEITISVFNTGSIIITGGNNIKNTMYAYRWINTFFDKHREQFLRPNLGEPKKKTTRIYYRDDISRLIMSENKADLMNKHRVLMEPVFAELLK